jgi:hypothetical protein
MVRSVSINTGTDAPPVPEILLAGTHHSSRELGKFSVRKIVTASLKQREIESIIDLWPQS